MKLYRTSKGVLLEFEHKFYLVYSDWRDLVNSDSLYKECESIVKQTEEIQDGEEWIANYLLKPIEEQEIWATGVTYFNSKMGRQEEAEAAGGVLQHGATKATGGT